MHPFYDFLLNNHWSETWAWWADFAANSLLLLFISWVLRIIARFILVNVSHRISGATKTTIDYALIDHKLPKNVSRFVPYFFLHAAIPFWSNGNETAHAWVTAIVDVYAVLIAILIIKSLLRAFRQQLQKQKQFRDKPIDSYIQVVMIFLWGIGILLALSILSGKELEIGRASCRERV